MRGVILAAAAGVGFGVAQAMNRRANRNLDPYRTTFVLFTVSFVLLVVVTMATQDLSLVLGAPPVAFAHLAVAGLIHFFLGWTLLTLSQQRLGAARTGALVGAMPLFGTALAWAVLGEDVAGTALAGMVMVVVGVVVLSLARGEVAALQEGGSASWGVVFGLGTALMWGSSPIFIRWGVEGLPSPILGVTIGLGLTVVAYAILLWRTGRLGRSAPRFPTARLRLLAATGIVTGSSVAALWFALTEAPVAVVLSLILLSTPVVVLVAPLVVGRRLEHLTSRVWTGAAAVFAGAIVLVLSRAGVQ